MADKGPESGGTGASPQFLRWRQRIEDNGNTLKKVEILADIRRQSTGLIGSFVDCLMSTPEGVDLPRCIFIKGDSVVAVPVLHCADDGLTYTMMVEQRRIIDGGLSLEFPAGSWDDGGEDPRAVASRELAEELGLVVPAAALHPLVERPVQIDPSFSGDLVSFFYFEMEMPMRALMGFDGKGSGCHEDGEYIRVRVRRMSEVAQALTSSALIGLKLLEMRLGVTYSQTACG